MAPPVYPFTGIVGMPDLKLALLLNAVSPAIGGVLVRGEKGTAKSTVVRGLAELLPLVPVVAGCRYACDPSAPDPSCPSGPHERSDVIADSRPVTLVELPVGATEDRLTGSLDIERALRGSTAFQPGLLAAAHRGVLYVDEVNLLHDHLVDLLLDAAALGVNYVEREGVSVRHAARFLLVGTMNPEEGELRPQLLDRFGLTVEVTASRDPAERSEVVRRRLAFEADPVSFGASFSDQTAALAARVMAAQSRLPSVMLPDAVLRQICAVCGAFGVDGMRADLVTARTAIALAAWEGREVVSAQDVRVAARLALPHRRRRDPFDAPGLDEQALEDALREAAGEPGPDGPDPDGPEPPDSGGHASPSASSAPASSASSATQAPVSPAAPYRARLLTVPGTGEGAPGRRSAARGPRGRTVAARIPATRLYPIHLPATIRAAAACQEHTIAPAHLREAVREGREGNLVLFAVDASGSMAARQRMRVVKTAIVSLLLDAYQRRDKVGLITFRHDTAEVALPPTSSVDAAVRRLTGLPTGGRTPLARGLAEAARVLAAERLRDPSRRPLLVVVTDGRATAGTDGDLRRAAALLHGTATVVVDCEQSVVRLGLAASLAAMLGAVLVPLDALEAAAARTSRAA